MSPSCAPSAPPPFLQGKALELSEQLGDLDLKAGMLCNMGNVLMQVCAGAVAIGEG